MALQRCNVNASSPDFWVEFWKVSFERWIFWVWIFQGASLAVKTGSKNSTQEFGSKIRASKICFPDFGPKFGFRRCKIPCAESCPSLGNEECAPNFFCTNFLNTSKFSGQPKFLSSKPKEDKLSRESTNFSATTPSREVPHPTGRSPDPKS